jgi:hypothetical protein
MHPKCFRWLFEALSACARRRVPVLLHWDLGFINERNAKSGYEERSNGHLGYSYSITVYTI